MQNRKRDTDVQNRLLDSVGEGEGGMFQENSIKTHILSGVKQITNPGWMHETSARAWCTGKTQRNRVEKKVGGWSGWGIHVTTWLIHANVWQKPLQYCKVFSLQLIKINETKKRKVKVKTLSRVWLLVTPWTAAYQAPPSMGFSRQEYSNGVPLPSPMPTVQMTVIEKLQQLLQFDYGTTDRDSLKDFSGACVQQMK